MKLFLDERERRAYISGDIGLAAELARYMDTVSALDNVIAPVREDVDDAQTHLAGVML